MGQSDRVVAMFGSIMFWSGLGSVRVKFGLDHFQMSYVRVEFAFSWGGVGSGMFWVVYGSPVRIGYGVESNLGWVEFDDKQCSGECRVGFKSG